MDNVNVDDFVYDTEQTELDNIRFCLKHICSRLDDIDLVHFQVYDLEDIMNEVQKMVTDILMSCGALESAYAYRQEIKDDNDE